MKKGGYVQKYKDDLELMNLEEIESKRHNQKLDLEIQTLKATLKNFKNTDIRSWIAIEISFFALIVTVVTNWQRILDLFCN